MALACKDIGDRSHKLLVKRKSSLAVKRVAGAAFGLPPACLGRINANVIQPSKADSFLKVKAPPQIVLSEVTLVHKTNECQFIIAIPKMGIKTPCP